MIKEENLLFIISQPRSGSSLLQQLLINTKRVRSVPEPWFMLPLVETFRPTSNQSGYNPYYAYVNFMEYLERYKGSKKQFVNEIRSIALKLYNLNILKGDEIYFLDKTPRNYHIIEELKELFPHAKFIILIRNPISVFSSILDYNFQGDIYKILKEDRYHDLFTAPKNIVSIIENWDQKDYQIIYYEDLVNDSFSTMKKLKEYLQLASGQTDNSYKVGDEFLSSRGVDKKALLSNNTINKEFINGWKKSIDNYQKKIILKLYIEKLGPKIINVLGYNYCNLLDQIANIKVKKKLPLKFNYLLKDVKNLSVSDFILSRINEKLNNILNL